MKLLSMLSKQLAFSFREEAYSRRVLERSDKQLVLPDSAGRSALPASRRRSSKYIVSAVVKTLRDSR